MSNSVICVTYGSKTCVGAVRALSAPRRRRRRHRHGLNVERHTQRMWASVPIEFQPCPTTHTATVEAFCRFGAVPPMAGGAPRDTPPTSHLSLHGPHGTADGIRPCSGMLPAPLTSGVDACSRRLSSLQVKLCSGKALAQPWR